MREFMLKQSTPIRLLHFSLGWLCLNPEVTAETAPLRVLVPAFVTSELKSSVPRLDSWIFHPVLVIDMVVSAF